MSGLHLIVGISVVFLNGVAGVWGLWCWRRCRPSKTFWLIVRAGQAALVLQVVLGFVLLMSGLKPQSSMHMLYALLAVAVAFVAEQLRIGAAEQVLEGRGIESAQAVGQLEVADQRQVVLAIVRRETLVLAVSYTHLTLPTILRV